MLLIIMSRLHELGFASPAHNYFRFHGRMWTGTMRIDCGTGTPAKAPGSLNFFVGEP